MVAVIYEPLGYIEGLLALRRLHDHLVLAQFVVGYAVSTPELRPQVVGVQDGHVGHVPELGAVHPDVVPCPEHLPEVAVETSHAPDALIGTHIAVRVALLLHRRVREEAWEVFRGGFGAVARPAAASGF